MNACAAMSSCEQKTEGFLSRTPNNASFSSRVVVEAYREDRKPSVTVHNGHLAEMCHETRLEVKGEIRSTVLAILARDKLVRNARNLRRPVGVLSRP